RVVSADERAAHDPARAARDARAGGLQRGRESWASGRRRHPRPRSSSRGSEVERRHQLHAGDQRREDRERALEADRGEAAPGLRHLTRPPTTVASTLPSCTTVRSQRNPGLRKPTSSSIPAAYAASAVKARSAEALLTASSGCHRARRRQPVAASMPSSGSADSTGASDPNASRAPALSSAPHAYALAATEGHSESASSRSETAWIGCIDAMTPMEANRFWSFGCTHCACSIRGRHLLHPRLRGESASSA